MLHSLKLLLPALIPSWNFFDIIAPSPRVQFCVLKDKNEVSDNWQDYRPRPEHVSFIKMLGRMLWNAHWNESLFVMSCAERMIDYPTQHSEDEILKRIANDYIKDNPALNDRFMQFRLIVIKRVGDELQQEQVYESSVVAVANYLIGSK